MNDEYRTDATLTGSEREQIESFLHDNRVEIVGLLHGLTEEQARRRLVPSPTTLLGLVKHAAFAERVWFDVALGLLVLKPLQRAFWARQGKANQTLNVRCLRPRLWRPEATWQARDRTRVPNRARWAFGW
jgi:Protein of unknown function (DUF664)